MALGKKTGGRQKGTPNKVSGTVRENVISVFDGLGGLDAMTGWARENQTEFYRLYSKLLPTQIDATVAERQMSKEEIDARLAAFGVKI